MQAQPGTRRPLPRMVVVTVGWMKYYSGAEHERPQGGGSYTKDNVGYESCNFLDLDGKLQGYFRTPFDKVNLERIAPEAGGTDPLDQVLVIFGATDPEGQGLKVVGWYRNARVYRYYQDGNEARRSFQEEYFGYHFEAPTAEAVLLPLEQRTQAIHRGANGMVRTSIFYPYDEAGQQRNLLWLEEIVDFVNNYQGDNLLRDQADPGKAAVAGAEEAREGKGQGFVASAKVRKAVEDRAMDKVKLHFKDGWVLENTSSNKPYDFCARRGNEERYIEVKGTQGDGSQVFLTKNEVKWARRHTSQMVLAVVTGIKVTVNGEQVTAEGGKLHLKEGWCPDEVNLEPLAYTYQTKL